MSHEVPEYYGNDDPTEILHRVVYLDDGFELSDLAEPENGLFDARKLLTTVVHLNDEHSLMDKRFSQTPLDPSILVEVSNFSYVHSVSRILESRITEIAMKYDLKAEYVNAIQREVTIELDKRTKSNDAAAARLFELLKGQMISENEAELIWRAKTAEATMAETGELLLRYPQIESMEALKYTEPLDWDAISRADKYMQISLGEFYKRVSDPSKVSLTIYHMDDREKRRPRMFTPMDISDEIYIEALEAIAVGKKDEIPNEIYDKILQSMIDGWKENIAEVSTDGTTIQLVQKTTMIKIGPTEDLNGVQPKLMSYKDGMMNLQPIARSWYWRVKPDVQ